MVKVFKISSASSHTSMVQDLVVEYEKNHFKTFMLFAIEMVVLNGL